MAAWKVCEDVGVDQLTMRRIGHRAKVTAPAIYRHFESKADVTQALIDEANRRLAHFLSHVNGRAGPREWLAQVCDVFLDFALKEPTAYDILFYSRSRTDEDLRPHEQRSDSFRFLLHGVQACLEGGVLRTEFDAMQHALALWAMMQGVLSMHLQGRFGGDEKLLCSVYRSSMTQLMKGVSLGEDS